MKLSTLASSFSPLRRGSLFYLFFFGSAGIFIPFINVYYLDLGFTGQQVGLIATLSPLMMVLFAAPLAALADRRRWRVRILQGALTGVMVTIFLLGFPRTFAAIAILATLMAFFFSPVLSIGDSLVARMAARHNLNYGSMRLWGSIGFASSAVLFGALWQQVGFQAMFVVGSLAFIAMIWIAGQQEEGPEMAAQERKPISDLLRDTGMVIILAASFLVGIALGLSIAFESIYMNYLGGGELMIGMLSGFSAFSELPTMRYGNVIVQRVRGPKALLLSYGLMGSAYLGYVFIRAPWALLLLAAVKGLGFGLFFTTTVRLVNERAPAEWSATAQALVTVGMFGLAPLVAGPLGGWVHDAVGPPAIFIGACAAIGCAVLVMLFAILRGTLD